MTKWLLCGYDSIIAAWVANQIKDMDPSDFKDPTTLAVMDGNEIICGVVYTNFYETSGIQMSVAALPGRKWAYPQFLRAFFTYPFVQLGVNRVTSVIQAKNAPSYNLASRLGFQKEGVLRCAAQNGEDLIVMGLLKQECRYLTGTDYGQKIPYASSGS